jgi:hypothetical protein
VKATVWDFLSLSSVGDEFTNYPHLTLNVTWRGVEAMVTVPDKANATARNNIRQLGEAGFLQKVEGAAPWFRGVQRRFRGQKVRNATENAIDSIARAWLACGPFVELTR